MRDRYDDMDTADLLREMCRKLDAIEKQGAPKVTHITRKPRTAPNVVAGELRATLVAGR